MKSQFRVAESESEKRYFELNIKFRTWKNEKCDERRETFVGSNLHQLQDIFCTRLSTARFDAYYVQDG